jgi:hypothetical protein
MTLLYLSIAVLGAIAITKITLWLDPIVREAGARRRRK